jgi:HK97 family phage portal protein
MNLSLRTRWGSAFNWIAALWNADKGEQRAPTGTGASSSGKSVSDEKALGIGAVFRCIRLLSETGSSLPLRAYEGNRFGERKPLADSHWLNGLIEEPNETMTGDELVEAMIAQMAGWGNGYSQIVPNAAGRPVELWPYKVDRMKVERNADRSLRYTYPDPNGTPVALPAGRVLHMRAFSLDGVMGVSPLGMARNVMGLAVAAEDYAGSFFASGGRPAGVMTTDKILNDKQREQIRKEYGGIADGGTDGKRFWLMEASLKYEAITVSPEDMQMLQTRSFQIKEIARFFGVPLHLLMETEGQTSWGTGLEQQNSAFLLYSLRPYLTRIQNTFNRFIISANERRRIFVEFDESPLMWADTAAQGTFLGALASNGLMSRNEGRARLKLPASKDPGAELLTVQTALTDLNRLGDPPAPPPAPPTPPPVTRQELMMTEVIQELRALKSGALPAPGPTVISLPRAKVARFDHVRDDDGRIESSVPVYEVDP